MVITKVSNCISFVFIILLSCYFNPVYDTDTNGGINNVKCILENGDDIDIFRVTVSSEDIDTICFYQPAKDNSLVFTVPQGTSRHIVINGYVSGEWAYTKAFTTDIPECDTTFSVELSIVQDPIPDAPQDVKLTLLPANVVKIAWSGSGYADGYKVFRSEMECDEGDEIASCNTTDYLDSTVCADRTYYYCIKAYNSSGISGISEHPSITIPPINELPEKPENLRAEDTSATSVTLSWNRVLAASSYKVYRINGSGTPNELIATIGNISFVDDSLLPVTVYSYAVSAVNSIGESIKSDKVTVQTKEPVPEAPENVAAKELSDVSIQVSWEAVAYASEYEIYGSLQQGGTYEKKGSATECTFIVSGLKPETTYFFKVKALNSEGSSGFSNTASAKTLPEQNQKPETPEGVAAEPLSPSIIRVYYNSVDKASHYNIYRSNSSTGTFSKVKSVVDTTASDSGLLENTTYYYKVSAENSAGESDMSDAVSATTFMHITVPTGLDAEALSSSDIGVSWNSVNGALSYKLFRSLNSGGVFDEIASPVSTSYTDTGLTSNTTYYYKVSAVGDYGESDLSDEVSATTQMPPPDTPDGLQAAALSATQIRIEFNAVADATGYILYWSLTQSGTYDSLASTGSTTYDHIGLTPDTEYFYKVCAYNDFGRSPLSDAVSARTDPGQVPDAPTGVEATALSSSEIEVQFNTVSDATGYKIYYSLSSTGYYTLVTTIATTSYTHSNLDADTEYFYKVTAYNDNGESCYSDMVSATTSKKVAYIVSSSCNGCARCVTDFTCPEGAIYATGGIYAIDPDKCNGCGDCMTQFSCPRGAIKMQDTLLKAVLDLWRKIMPKKGVKNDKPSD